MYIHQNKNEKINKILFVTLKINTIFVKNLKSKNHEL